MRWALIGLALLAFVLVPFVLFEERFNALAGEWTAAQGPSAAIAIGALLALDIVLPIPSSVLSTAAGALLGFPLGTLVSTVGMTLASAAGYWLGTGTSARARRFVGAASLERAQRLAERYGDWAVIVSRPVPVLAEASAVAAGLLRRPAGRFLLLSAAANLGISLAYAAVGAFAMSAGSFLWAFAGALLLPGLAMWLLRRQR
jgi:uncharacterized membrane protein YdjX (TVP38/TMEM64 family)